MPFAPECCWVFEGRATFWAIFEKFNLVPLCTFSQNAGFGWPCENCHNLAIRALFDPHCALKSFAVFALQVHTKKRIMLFAPECFLVFQTRATFLGDFWKISLCPPFAPFQKKRVLGDVAKIAITWSFGTFWSCFLRQTLVQSLH